MLKNGFGDNFHENFKPLCASPSVAICEFISLESELEDDEVVSIFKICVFGLSQRIPSSPADELV